MNNSKLYLEYNQAQRADAQSILSEFSHCFRWNRDGRDVLLDIVCGPGDVLVDFIVPLMPAKFDKVVGVDLSSKMIEFARKKFQNEKIVFHQIDISDDLETCKEKVLDPCLFDNITTFCCLHWIQDQRQAISNIYNMLKPNGTVIMSFLVSSPSYDIYETLSEMSEYKDYTRNINSFVSPYHHERNPMQVFENHISSVGFQAMHVEIRERSFIYEPEQLRNAVKAVNPFTEGMPECLREQFLDDYVKIADLIGDNNAVMEDNSTIVSRYRLMVAVLTKQSRI